MADQNPTVSSVNGAVTMTGDPSKQPGLGPVLERRGFRLTVRRSNERTVYDVVGPNGRAVIWGGNLAEVEAFVGGRIGGYPSIPPVIRSAYEALVRACDEAGMWRPDTSGMHPEEAQARYALVNLCRQIADALDGKC